MAKTFKQIDYKNFEQLRFYLSKDIKRIDNKIGENSPSIKGYFIGSLVDLLIVFLFGDNMDCFLRRNVHSTGCQIFIKVLILAGLIVLFFLVSRLHKKFHNWKQKTNDVSGRSQYIEDTKRQELIDDFDNIACDGLLICQNYIRRYEHEKQDYVQEFFLYEVIHYLRKASEIFDEIYCKQDLYVSSKNNQLLDSYRINNFIEFAQNIMKFLSDHISNMSQNEELDKDMTNLSQVVNKWEKI